MTIGIGKYDGELTTALKEAKAVSGALIVMDGKKGAGFSIQVEESLLQSLPKVLEYMASQIRVDFKEKGIECDN